MFVSKHVSMRCDCLCSTIVFEKFGYDDGDIDYDISFVDSCLDWEINTIWHRIKVAWFMLIRKPVYYAGVTTADKAKVREFAQGMLDLIDEDDGALNGN
jgi:hypothetical protein